MIFKKYKNRIIKCGQNVCVLLSFMVYPSQTKINTHNFNTVCFRVAKILSVHFVVVEIDVTHILICSQCTVDRIFPTARIIYQSLS